MSDTLRKKNIFYGLRWDGWLLWEYQNKTLTLTLILRFYHDTVEMFNYKKKMIVKFKYIL